MPGAIKMAGYIISIYGYPNSIKKKTYKKINVLSCLKNFYIRIH